MTDADRPHDAMRRLFVYVVYDPRGVVDDFKVDAVRELRRHGERLVAVVNGPITPEGEEMLAAVADDVIVRENVGFDIWAHREVLTRLGDDLAAYDEVILTNDTWIGPVRPLAPVLARMRRSPADLWGMTDHPRYESEISPTGTLVPYHLQSYWIAVRRRLFLSEEWASFWEGLPPLGSWHEAVYDHEVHFTEHFTSRGFTADVAFPFERYDTENPSVFSVDDMLDDGLPLLKRKPLYFWPPTMLHHGSIGRWTMQKAGEGGLQAESVLAGLARNSPPRDLNTDLGMLDVFAAGDDLYDPSRPLRVAVVAHIFYTDMTEEIVRRADHMPGPYDLIVTTVDAERAAEIGRRIAAMPPRGRGVDVRIVGSNDGRDQSAFLIACRDVLTGDAYDVVVKVHSKRSPQQGQTVGGHFQEQQLDNLLPSAAHVANVLARFQREPGLGLMYPPMIHIGHGTLGHAWWGNRPRFERTAAMLGLSVPIDDVSPLAPFGSMYFARPEALRILVEHDWRYADFGGVEQYVDGGLAHVLERMPSYVAAELGFHTRTVLAADYAELSHTSLEFKLDEMSASVPGPAREKATLLGRMGPLESGSGRDLLLMHLRVNRPRVFAWLRERADRSQRLNRLLIGRLNWDRGRREL